MIRLLFFLNFSNIFLFLSLLISIGTAIKQPLPSTFSILNAAYCVFPFHFPLTSLETLETIKSRISIFPSIHAYTLSILILHILHISFYISVSPYLHFSISLYLASKRGANLRFSSGKVDSHRLLLSFRLVICW